MYNCTQWYVPILTRLVFVNIHFVSAARFLFNSFPVGVIPHAFYCHPSDDHNATTGMIEWPLDSAVSALYCTVLVLSRLQMTLIWCTTSLISWCALNWHRVRYDIYLNFTDKLVSHCSSSKQAIWAPVTETKRTYAHVDLIYVTKLLASQWPSHLNPLPFHDPWLLLLRWQCDMRFHQPFRWSQRCQLSMWIICLTRYKHSNTNHYFHYQFQNYYAKQEEPCKATCVIP